MEIVVMLRKAQPWDGLSVLLELRPDGCTGDRQNIDQGRCYRCSQVTGQCSCLLPPCAPQPSVRQGTLEPRMLPAVHFQMPLQGSLKISSLESKKYAFLGH